MNTNIIMIVTIITIVTCYYLFLEADSLAPQTVYHPESLNTVQ